MNAMFFKPHHAVSLPKMDVTGWTTIVKAEAEDVKNKDIMDVGVVPLSPGHQRKRRLTHVDPPAKPEEDPPVNLSKKVKPQPAIPHAIKDKDTFSCDPCGETFSAYDHLVEHIVLGHQTRTPDAQKQNKCKICNHLFASSENMTRHARLHSGEKPYDCPICGRPFARSDNLVEHQHTHTGQRPFSCPACPYAASRRSTITRHMKTQHQHNQQVSHGNPPAKPKEDASRNLSKKAKPHVPHPIKDKETFSCGACGVTFPVHDCLVEHMALGHCNRTPDAQQQYECKICEYRFASSENLTRHARLHSGEKPYACPICERPFARSDNLAVHQRTHTGQKPFRCPACPYAACRRDTITRHMKTHT